MARIKMIETYGRLEAGAEYEVDDSTARSLQEMGKAEPAIAPVKRKMRRRRK